MKKTQTNKTCTVYLSTHTHTHTIHYTYIVICIGNIARKDELLFGLDNCKPYQAAAAYIFSLCCSSISFLAANSPSFLLATTASYCPHLFSTAPASSSQSLCFLLGRFQTGFGPLLNPLLFITIYSLCIVCLYRIMLCTLTSLAYIYSPILLIFLIHFNALPPLP